MIKTAIGYAILIIVYIASIFFGSEHGILLPIFGAILAVAVGTTVGNINLLGIAVVFLFLSFFFPFTILYWLGAKTGLESPLERLLDSFEWMRAILPMIGAFLTYLAVGWIKKRALLYGKLRKKEKGEEKGDATL